MQHILDGFPGIMTCHQDPFRDFSFVGRAGIDKSSRSHVYRLEFVNE